MRIERNIPACSTQAKYTILILDANNFLKGHSPYRDYTFQLVQKKIQLKITNSFFGGSSCWIRKNKTRGRHGIEREREWERSFCWFNCKNVDQSWQEIQADSLAEDSSTYINKCDFSIEYWCTVCLFVALALEHNWMDAKVCLDFQETKCENSFSWIKCLSERNAWNNSRRPLLLCVFFSSLIIVYHFVDTQLLWFIFDKFFFRV